MKTRLLALAAVAAAAGTVAVGAAQSDKMATPDFRAEAIIYRDADYQGPAVNVSRAESNMGLAWRVKSIRVRSGRWELCEKSSFRGKCAEFDRDNPSINNVFKGMVVQSMRPVGNGGGSWGPMEPGRNPSLRGMAAEFYSQPALRGYRVPACTTGNASASCAERSAQTFCSAMGWRRSVRQAMETVRGRVYLADVLCSNTGY